MNNNTVFTKILLAGIVLLLVGYFLGSSAENNKQPRLYNTGTRECLNYEDSNFCTKAKVATVDFVSSLAVGDKICVLDPDRGWSTEYEVVKLPKRRNDESLIISLMDSSGAVHEMPIHSIGLREQGDNPYGLPSGIPEPPSKGPLVYRYVCSFPN